MVVQLQRLVVVVVAVVGFGSALREFAGGFGFAGIAGVGTGIALVGVVVAGRGWRP